jgi:hypothetical protein
MASDLAATKQHLWSEIERRRDELARLCADGLKLPAENPPRGTSPTTTRRSSDTRTCRWSDSSPATGA